MLLFLNAVFVADKQKIPILVVGWTSLWLEPTIIHKLFLFLFPGVKTIKEMEDEIARFEEGNLLDICYILDKMNTFDRSLINPDSELTSLCSYSLMLCS
jgi:hypothetical protein